MSDRTQTYYIYGYFNHSIIYTGSMKGNTPKQVRDRFVKRERGNFPPMITFRITLKPIYDPKNDKDILLGFSFDV